jgi:hypothetical protein
MPTLPGPSIVLKRVVVRSQGRSGACSRCSMPSVSPAPGQATSLSANTASSPNGLARAFQCHPLQNSGDRPTHRSRTKPTIEAFTQTARLGRLTERANPTCARKLGPQDLPRTWDEKPKIPLTHLRSRGAPGSFLPESCRGGLPVLEGGALWVKRHDYSKRDRAENSLKNGDFCQRCRAEQTGDYTACQ